MDTQNQNNTQPQTNQVPDLGTTTPVPEPNASDAMASQSVAPAAEPVTTSVPVSEPAASAPAVEPTVEAMPAVEPQTVIEPTVPGIEPTGAPAAQDAESELGLSDESSASAPAADASASAPVEPTSPEAPSPTV